MTIAGEAETCMPGTPAQAHPVLAGVREAINHVGAAAESAIWGLSDDALGEAIGACEQLRARTHALELALVRDADGRDIGRRAGAASTAAWLSGRFRVRPGQARAWVQLANATDEIEEVLDYASNVSGPRSGRELVETAKALAAAEISPEHVAVVGKIMRSVPREVPAEQAARVEHDIAEFCREFDPATVARLGDYMLELLRGEHLDDEEDDRHRRRTLRFNEETGGISGQLTREGIALLRTALDPLAAPNPADDGTLDGRSPGQRLADALVELARRAIASDEFATNHGMTHRVMLSIGLDALADAQSTTAAAAAGTGNPPGATTSDGAVSGDADRRADAGDPADAVDPGDAGVPGEGSESPEVGVPSAGGKESGSAFWPGVAPAQMQWGSWMSAAATLRLACHASIQRIVLDPAGAVLDVGREYRTATAAQFAALIARDGGCAFPGCTRPPSWCVAHHLVHWAHGGETNLDNLVMLCGHHHRVVHHQGWSVAIDRRDRLPAFHPPRWVDPDQRPRRNKRPRPGRRTRGRADGRAP